MSFSHIIASYLGWLLWYSDHGYQMDGRLLLIQSKFIFDCESHLAEYVQQIYHDTSFSWGKEWPELCVFSGQFYCFSTWTSCRNLSTWSGRQGRSEVHWHQPLSTLLENPWTSTLNQYKALVLFVSFALGLMSKRLSPQGTRRYIPAYTLTQ